MIIFMKDHETCFSISAHEAASLMKRLPGGALIGSPLLQICTDVLFLRQRRRTFFYGCITGGSCRRRIGRPFFLAGRKIISVPLSISFPVFPANFTEITKTTRRKSVIIAVLCKKAHFGE
jgi:hypothetical protein